VFKFKIFSFIYFKVPPNKNFYSDIRFNFSQNSWDGCRPAFLMDKSPLKKRIILRTGTGRYNHVFEGGRKKMSWKTIKVKVKVSHNRPRCSG
jgi:hypothetical protein